MLVIVFGFLLALTLVFLLTGQYMDAPFLKISGSVFMFLLGMIVMFGSLSIQNGLNESTIYSYEAGNLSRTNTTTVYTYSNISSDIVNGLNINHLFGFLMCVIGVFLFMFAFLEIKKPREID